MPAGETKRLFLVDAMGFIFRAYHVPTQEFRAPDGRPTKVAFLFTNMLRRLLKGVSGKFEPPDYLAVVFDVAAPTFRDKLFDQYKANRPPMPEDLASQLPQVRAMCQAMRLPILEYPGYEADDVIATLARQASACGHNVFVVTSDKDLLQIVNERTCVLIPTKDDLVCDPAQVEELMGVAPEKITDLLALMGDSIDNIPGAKGIGEKGARELIAKYGAVENAIEHAAEVPGKRYREALQTQRDQILMSKKLATVHSHAPIELRLDELRRQPPDSPRLIKLLTELGFGSMLREALAAPPGQEIAPEEADYRVIETAEGLTSWLGSLKPGEETAVWLDIEGEEDFTGRLAGLAFSPSPGVARAIPHGGPSMLAAARPFLEDPARPKVVHNAKILHLLLGNRGVELQGIRQATELYSYLLQPTTPAHDLEAVALRHLSLRLSGNLAEKADVVGRLARKLGPEIEAQQLADVFRAIELPLAPVLARMERHGVKVDAAALEQMSAGFEIEIAALTARIFSLAAVEFNLNSPKQLAGILFDKMNLPMPAKYAKGKVRSTAADVLEDLAELHELPKLILDYRELAKLKSTYIDALPKLIHPQTGRLHTSFRQTGTATGRLSSSNPNLQNIPIRSELGKKIRAAFVAEEGSKLLSADYSQIELRVLAHFSEDPVLLDAFRKGEDIHARTAAEVFGVPPLMQTGDHRRRAKVINFGIIYGLSAFGLSQQLAITPQEAQEFINAYFARYAGVKAYLERTLAECRKTGTVRTLAGRLRPIPEINSKQPNLRNFAERTALNTPLQGTAADLIKLAMIEIDRRLAADRLLTKMILQVHDELLFEVPEAEMERAQALIKPAMEQAYPLKVPLVANLGVGSNWRDIP